MADKAAYLAYGSFTDDLQAEIRREAFGEDIGQFSWITADEFRTFLARLQVEPDDLLLDVACGSGGLALYAEANYGFKVLGVDISEHGIALAKKAATAADMESRVRFEHLDAAKPLPLEDESVDGIYCVDAMNHIWARDQLLLDWKRVLKPSKRFIFSDAVVVGGMLTRDDVLARSAGMGNFIFTPAGLHEQAIQRAGFVEIEALDLTATIASTAQRWHDARAGRHHALVELEGSEQFFEMQAMLATAASLSRERRLLRVAYTAKKPG